MHASYAGPYGPTMWCTGRAAAEHMVVLHGIYRVACVSGPEQVVNEAAAKTAEAAGLKVVCSVAECP